MASGSRRTGLVFDERCFGHRNPSGGPPWLAVPPFERPERLAETFRALEGAGLLRHLERLPARSAPRAALELVHDASHVERVLAEPRAPLRLDHEAWVGPGSATAALLAVGGMLEAVAAVVAREVDNAFVLARPPGHHATIGRGMGFCLINSVAVAAAHALARGLERVAIVDWDVHHGNGTQDIFYDRADVLFCSVHQYGHFYPGTGAASERGDGAGKGYTINAPLSAGGGDLVYRQVFDELFHLPIQEFHPELILVSAGFDAHEHDPLGSMAVTEQGFADLTKRVMRYAEEAGHNRVVALLEGGYDPTALGRSVVTVLQTLDGVAPERYDGEIPVAP